MARGVLSSGLMRTAWEYEDEATCRVPIDPAVFEDEKTTRVSGLPALETDATAIDQPVLAIDDELAETIAD